MENRENLSGNESRPNNQKTTRYELNNQNQDQNHEKNFSPESDSGNDSEVNLSELDQTEVNLDRDGVDNAQGSEVNEFGRKESSNTSPGKQSSNPQQTQPTPTLRTKQ